MLSLSNQVLALKKDLEAAEQEVAALEASAHLAWSAASQQMTEQGQVRLAAGIVACISILQWLRWRKP